MNAVGRLGSYISRGVYTVSGPFHPFGGCVDIIVVEQQDGSFKSSPWYVRFGKFQGVLKTREKVVNISVNGSDANFHMFLDHKGEAYFLREAQPESVLNSSSSGDDDSPESSVNGVNSNVNGKSVVARTNSRRGKILGLVFGRNSSDRGDDEIRRADSLERAEFAANLLEVKWSTNLDPHKPLIDNTSSRFGNDRRVLEQSFVYSESSESSVLRNEENQESLYIVNGDSGELCVQSEVVHARTESFSQETVVERVLEDYKLEVSRVAGIEECVEKIDYIDNYNVVLEETLVDKKSFRESNHTDTVLVSSDEVVSQDICTVSSFDNSFRNSEDEERIMIVEDAVQRSASLEEEQLLFGDIDEFRSDEVRRTVSSSSEEEAMDSSLNGKNEESEKLMDCESSTGNNLRVTITSNPIAITGVHKVVVDEEVGRLTESLPNMWSPTDSFRADDDVDCLSHSLDSNSKSLNWELQNNDNSNSTKSDGNEESRLVPESSDMSSGFPDGEVKDVSSTPKIEMSLCKHLFYQGMTSHAASQAFDAEKLDFEKFSSLGPEIVKDERLVVRINGHYFPWDVAAPMVLGMVSFGPKHVFEPKGMIAFDHVEKPVTGDPSNLSMSPSVNWRLWPFSFRRSRSRKAIHPSLSDVTSSDVENTSEVKINVAEDSTNAEPKMAKKMVRANTPTSEQLASLNLKEGRNNVTFTFLTPMLGKQQVDCRIYLWKWNTRIVISDVDGTITRSDVLGQFMPLVGVDWSHLGVAHLFSAIKENGYQLLFLSARAISQAYITRQFLFNLKQDGKALPDGPVVISPDGLFPSLYREVIRRAPHEFKISCLEEIRSLFPSDCNPFYAGFGNRDTDEISYLKVGIPKGKIFIINPRGEVAVNRRVDTKSYKSIHALVNGMFPSTASSEQEDYNSWNFWKLPPPTIDL